jgi:anaphase-promoting complex subunit 2
MDADDEEKASAIEVETATSAASHARFDQYLSNYKKQLAHFMYTHYAHVRIRRLFDIIIDFPDSRNSIDDLKLCLAKTNLRTHVIKSLTSSIEQRLLHPGVGTSDILTAYVAAIKALLCLDSTGVMMENICEPLRKYLRNRDDTVKCIVSNLTDDCDSTNDIMEEFCKDLYSNEPGGGGNGGGQADVIIDSTIAAPFVYDTARTWQQWQPDPIDAINLNNDYPGSKSNIISMLVNIYGSKDLFVNEYKTLLGDRLLSSYSYNMEKEIRNLELLKVNFFIQTTYRKPSFIVHGKS